MSRLSAFAGSLCWIIPLLVHDRVRRINGWILGGLGNRWGWVVVAALAAVAVAAVVISGDKLYGIHKSHLEVRLRHGEATIQPPPSGAPETPRASESLPKEPVADKPDAKSNRVRRKPRTIERSAPSSESAPKSGIALSVAISNPSDPVISVENLSDSLADRVTWELVVFRISDAGLFSFATQDIGYLKPNSKGPGVSMGLEKLPRAPGGDQLKVGDEFIGSLVVDCPT